MLATLTRLFPLWAILLSVAAYYSPTTFLGIGPWVAYLLMLIMFGMGVTLNIDDFKRVLTRPAPVIAAPSYTIWSCRWPPGRWLSCFICRRISLRG